MAHAAEGARRSGACAGAQWVMSVREQSRQTVEFVVGMKRCVLVPLDCRALDADERERDARLPVLRRLEDEVVERLADPE